MVELGWLRWRDDAQPMWHLVPIYPYILASPRPLATDQGNADACVDSHSSNK